ncbi:HNH endonuclease family protein [Mycolicibacterium frederiksbergense]|uniref:HNH endonuclease family protein n=1 Tax=Mycolicibacterium frederiksbergense TaxID=117567 RepID=UPI002473257B|nr:HNH endonuclease family protein [Mycolicibacterium frederiksbergense]
MAVAVVLAVVAVLVLARARQADPQAHAPSQPQSPSAGQLPISSPAPSFRPQRTPGYDQARTLLAALPVKGWDRETDFSRARFGEAWSDDVNVEFGHNGCNTRDDILRRDLADLVVRPGTCFAASGVLHDPYTGAQIVFVRGPDTSSAVQIDHLVSLSDAWYKGARTWDPQRRKDFANDPRNLIAVAGQANFDKAFRDAAGWLPPNAAFRCEFVARQVEVKAGYRLWVSAKEKRAMAAVLDNC